MSLCRVERELRDAEKTGNRTLLADIVSRIAESRREQEFIESLAAVLRVTGCADDLNGQALFPFSPNWRIIGP